MRFPPRRWGSVVIWLAANGLRWLVVVAVIAWANPQLLHWHVEILPSPPMPIRTIQIKPCALWNTELGRWYGGYVCLGYLGAEARYRYSHRKF